MSANPLLPWTLNPALSYCKVGNRHVFLDIAGDRYFCLAERLEAAFGALVDGTVPDNAAIGLLHAERLLVPGAAGAPLRPCPADTAPAGLLDGPAPTRLARHYPGLIAAIVRTRRHMRRESIAALLCRLMQARAAGSHAAAAHDAVPAAVAHAFERLALFSTTHDQCLVRSLALAHYLARRGCAAEIVFAVRLQPFKAHCWVEYRGAIVNDRLERVRHFTPIRRA